MKPQYRMEKKSRFRFDWVQPQTKFAFEIPRTKRAAAAKFCTNLFQTCEIFITRREFLCLYCPADWPVCRVRGGKLCVADEFCHESWIDRGEAKVSTFFSTEIPGDSFLIKQATLELGQDLWLCDLCNDFCVKLHVLIFCNFDWSRSAKQQTSKCQTKKQNARS